MHQYNKKHNSNDKLTSYAFLYFFKNIRDKMNMFTIKNLDDKLTSIN